MALPPTTAVGDPYPLAGGIRVGPRPTSLQGRVLAFALAALLLGLPFVVAQWAQHHCFRAGGVTILGPRFVGQAPLSGGWIIAVSRESPSPRLAILRPVPPGRRYRWKGEGDITYAELVRDYGGSVSFHRSGRATRVQRLWLGFVLVRP